MFMLQPTASPVVTATLWLLIIFSVTTWTIIVVKFWRQLRLARQNAAFHLRFWQAKSWQAAGEEAEQNLGSLAALARAGFEVMANMRKPGADLAHSGDLQDILERSLRQEVQNQQGFLDTGLAPLASIGSTAPFVGLFGTVWGIMHALQVISKTGSAGLDVVAGPIGEALIATALGIATAVPAVLAYNFFLRRLKINIGQLENFATDFLHLAIKNNLKSIGDKDHGN